MYLVEEGLAAFAVVEQPDGDGLASRHRRAQRIGHPAVRALPLEQAAIVAEDVAQAVARQLEECLRCEGHRAIRLVRVREAEAQRRTFMDEQYKTLMAQSEKAILRIRGK